MCSDSDVSGGFSSLVLDQLLQLLPVSRKPIYINVKNSINLKRFLGLKMWYMLQYVKSTETLQWQDDNRLIDLINNVWIEHIDEYVEEQINKGLLENKMENIQKNVLYMFVLRTNPHICIIKEYSIP